MNGTELTRAAYLPSDSEINRHWRIAEALASSKRFPEAKETAQAFAVMLIGHDLGLSPTQALMGIHIVEGKPLISATTLAGFVREAPWYDYRITEHDETKCSIEFIRQPPVLAVSPGESVTLGTSTFTIEEAGKAGLVKPKSGWEKYPKAMLFARAMSQGVRWFCPDVVGGVPIYTEGDELEVRRALTHGDGEPSGIDLGPRVEAVLTRAEELGHAGIADRGAAELALGRRSPEQIKAWADEREAELNTFADAQAAAEEQPEDAEVVGNDKLDAATGQGRR